MALFSFSAVNLLTIVGRIALFGGIFLALVGAFLTLIADERKLKSAEEALRQRDLKLQQAQREFEQLGKRNLGLTMRQDQAASPPPAPTSRPGKRLLLVEALSGIAPKPSIYVQRITGDADAKAFGDELVASFFDARISISDNPVELSPALPEGLTIIGAEPADQDELSNAFRNAGFTPTVLQGGLPKGYSHRVTIGLKPPSFE
jgi:hypothetical protein